MNITACRLIRFFALVFLLIGAAPIRAGTLTWINASGGNWNVAGNWNPVGVPGAGDTATITAAGTYIVSVTDTESIGSFNLGGGSGTQTLQVDSGGVLNAAGGTISDTGSVTVKAGGVLDLASAFGMYAPLTNFGTMNLTNAQISLYNISGGPYFGGIDNQGQINFYGAIGNQISCTSATAYVTNQGTINEEAGAGPGVINAFQGSLSGTYNAAAGTTVEFTGGSGVSPLTVGTLPVLNGPGVYEFTANYLLLTKDVIPNLELTGGTLELGPLFQDGGAITNLTLGTVTLGGGPYQVDGTLDAPNDSALSTIITVNSGGVLKESNSSLSDTGWVTVKAGGVLDVASAFSVYGPVTNFGTMNLTNAQISLYNIVGGPYFGGIDNQGQINFYGAAGDQISCTSASAYVTNQGTINEEAGAGPGVINAYQGSLSGTYNAAAGTIVEFTGGSGVSPLTVGTLPVLNGPGVYEFASGYLLLTKDVIPNLELTGGTLELGPLFQDGGAITNLTLGTVTLGGGPYQVDGRLNAPNDTALNTTITVNSGGVLQASNSSLSDTGWVTVKAGGVLDVASAFSVYGPVTNFGTMNLTNAQISLYNIVGGPYFGGIDNQGQINFYGAAGDQISCTSASAYVTNQGTINEEAGAGPGVINAYQGSLSGTYNAAAGTIVEFTGGSGVSPLTVGTLPVLNGPGVYEFASGYLLLTKDVIPNLELTGGTLELGPLFQDGGAITNLTLGTVTLGGGPYQVDGRLNAPNDTALNTTITVNSGGVLQASNSSLSDTGWVTVKAGGVLDVASAFSVYGPVTNFGTMNLTNAQISLYNIVGGPYFGGIDNQGQINFYGAAGDQISCTSASAYVTNQGTINEEAGAGPGVINAYQGSLSGTYNAAAGTIVEFTGGSGVSPLTVGTLPVLNGPGVYEFASGYLLLTKDVIPNLELTGGTLELGPLFQDGGAITNLTLGTVTLGGGPYQVDGTLEAPNNSALSTTITVNSGGVLQASNSSLSDTGSVTVKAGGVLDVASAFAAYGPLTNFGTMNLTNAQISIYNISGGPYFGGINNQGQINFYGAAGDEINCTSASVYVINQGTISQRRGTGPSSINATVLTDPGTLDSQGGTLTLDGVALQSSSVLNFGLNSATDYGSIILDASAVLSGTVSANFNGGFAPVIGDSFNVLSYPSFFGIFAQTNLPSGFGAEGVYGAKVFSLQITATGAPPTQPVVSIKRLDATTVTISWPTAAGNFNLQSTTNLSSRNWGTISSGISVDGADYELTETVNGAPTFFRLKSQ